MYFTNLTLTGMSSRILQTFYKITTFSKVIYSVHVLAQT